MTEPKPTYATTAVADKHLNDLLELKQIAAGDETIAYTWPLMMKRLDEMIRTRQVAASVGVPTPQPEETAVPPSGVPIWAKELIHYWRDKLLLTSWSVEIFSSAHPHDDVNCMGLAMLYPEILTAHITLRDDIPQEPTAEWERVIIHEMVHVRLAEITELVAQEFIPELGAAAERIATAAFRRAVEPTVESLAHVLWGLNDDSSNSD